MATLRLMCNARVLALLGFSTLMQALNWFIFLWAISHQQATQAVLGYFLLPLINVLIGIVQFRERLDGPQKVAICIFGESVSPLQLLSFGLIWLGLAFMIVGTLRRMRTVRALQNG